MGGGDVEGEDENTTSTAFAKKTVGVDLRVAIL